MSAVKRADADVNHPATQAKTVVVRNRSAPRVVAERVLVERKAGRTDW
jgi:hypothetical protein